ncbi:MAG: hypothetical protein ABGY42_04635, partial [bacterium]
MEDYVFEIVHESPLVGGGRVLVYSCAVRENGDAHGKPLGVLGIVFRWDELAQTIVKSIPFSDADRSMCRVCIVASDGSVLADSEGRIDTSSGGAREHLRGCESWQLLQTYSHGY